MLELFWQVDYDIKGKQFPFQMRTFRMKSSASRPNDESTNSDPLTRGNSTYDSNPISDWSSELTSKNEAILKSIEDLIDQSLQSNPEEA